MKTLTVFKAIRKTVIEVYHRLNLKHLESTTGRPLAMKIVDVITLGLYKQQQNIGTKKALYNDFQPECSYKTFVVSINRCAWIIALVIALILKMNQKNSHVIKHTDSSDVPVCKIKKAYKHRVMQDCASWGAKAKNDWFYGLKLHITTDLEGKLCSLKFTSGNVDDRVPFMDLNDMLDGIFVADSGYVSERLAKIFNNAHRILFTKPRSNMKKIITETQYHLYNTRVKIEVNFQVLKQSRGLVTGFPRSVAGYFAHYLYALGAHLLVF
jgi:hypothetical protein